MPETAAPGAPQDCSVTRDLFGLIRLAGMCVAIPVGSIREVVPCPPHFDPFPATRADVIGAMELRGQVIPVLDLGAMLGVGPTISPGPRIVVVLLADDKVYGVLGETIDGVCSLQNDAIGAMALGGGGDASTCEAGSLVRATFHLGARRGIVLDPAAMAMLPGLPLAEGRAGQTVIRQADEEPTLIFTVGELRCALRASCVDATVPRQELAPAPVEDRLWIAMLPYKGAEIPVLDTLAVLEHGAMAEGTRIGSAIVVRAGERTDGGAGTGLVALLIDSVDDIVRLSTQQIRPLTRHRLAGAALVAGLIDSPAGPCVVIDDTKLIADPRLTGLGAIEQRRDEGARADRRSFAAAEPGETATHRPAPERQPFLVFSLGAAPYAVPLDTVEEILPGGQDVVALPDSGRGVEGFFIHREQAVPVVDLARCLHVAGDEGRFIVVMRDGCGSDIRRTGFRVDSLCSVDRTAVQRIAATSASRGTSAPLGLPGSTIRLADGRACAVVDFSALADGISAAL